MAHVTPLVWALSGVRGAATHAYLAPVAAAAAALPILSTRVAHRSRAFSCVRLPCGGLQLTAAVSSPAHRSRALPC
eukprot:4334975-Prymnesium_polylepis.1